MAPGHTSLDKHKETISNPIALVLCVHLEVPIAAFHWFTIEWYFCSVRKAFLAAPSLHK